jgi:ABC-type transport system involved in multi-copper enzyme maturation permease subunit
VIWLTWRRYRVLLAVIVILMIGLSLWMAEAVHAFDAARQSATCRPLHQGGHLVPYCSGPRGFVSLPAQASIIGGLLLALPCVIGATFGAPLVASELEQSTNRLMWTQGISRTRWFLSKWSGLAVVLLVVVGLLTLETQWWTSHVFETASLNFSPGTYGRMSPDFFAISGVAAVAYTLLALALGTLAGAFLRRTSWAIAATIVGYALFASLMVIAIRPNLAPQTFARTPQLGATAPSVPPTAWYLGTAYRYVPGSTEAAHAVQSADAAGAGCERRFYWGTYQDVSKCLSSRDIQTGSLYILPSHYWGLQWKESVILLAFSAILIAGAVWSVRAWRA